MDPSFTFRRLQHEQEAWANYNFGPTEPGQGLRRAGLTLLGVVEETGELADQLPDGDQHIVELTRALGRLAHSTLKPIQNIRKGEDHEAKAQDAVADIIVYLVDLCHRRGWDLQDIVERTWNEVAARDWVKDRVGGKAA